MEGCVEHHRWPDMFSRAAGLGLFARVIKNVDILSNTIT